MSKEEKAKKEKKTKNKGKAKKVILILLGIFMVLMIGAGIFAWSYWNKLLEGCPELDLSKRYNYSIASTVYDVNEEEIAAYVGNENIEWVKIDEIPDQLKDAFIAIEDKRFYTHPGIDIRRLISAVIGQITHSSNHGGSTITQQLIKNMYLTRAKTYERKAQEIHLALQLEKQMSKDEILEWYLNILYLGETNYGVKIAAQDYFGKELNELSLRECAALAGLVQSPNVYNPRVAVRENNYEPMNYRINTVLYTMHEQGKITDEEYEYALNDTFDIKESTERFLLYDYPTYVEYAIEDVAKELLEKDGKPVTSETLQEMRIKIRNEGYQIYTAFDRNIQDIAQQEIHDFDNYPRTENGEDAEVSAVIMDHHNGRVVAMIGGRSETQSAEGFNRATDSLQAVGSSIKPLSVYAPALDCGCNPGTTVLDIKEKIEGYNTDEGYPGGLTDEDVITMRRALEQSHNIPAVRFLLEKVGIDKALEYMEAEGFDLNHISPSPAGMALGASDVSTLEMTAAYATLANLGEYIEPHAYIKVLDRDGNVILDESTVERHQVYKESTSWLVTDMMETNMVNGLGVRGRLKHMHCAGKTGTHEQKVISFGGYTPYYTSFVRVSSDDYVNLIKPSSYYMTSALWKAYMQPIHEGLEDKEILPKSAEELGIYKVSLCSNSGLLPKEDCPTHYEYVTDESKPKERCSQHYYPNKEDQYECWWDENGVFHDNGWWDENGVFHLYTDGY